MSDSGSGATLWGCAACACVRVWLRCAACGVLRLARGAAVQGATVGAVVCGCRGWQRWKVGEGLEALQGVHAGRLCKALEGSVSGFCVGGMILHC